MFMTEMKSIGIKYYGFVRKVKKAKTKPSYFKVKPGSNTAPKTEIKLIKMPERVL